MIEAGFTGHFKRNSSDVQLAAANYQRKLKKGIWSDENRVAPREWRKLKKQNRSVK